MSRHPLNSAIRRTRAGLDAFEKTSGGALCTPIVQFFGRLSGAQRDFCERRHSALCAVEREMTSSALAQSTVQVLGIL